jgi:hypothetical protein
MNTNMGKFDRGGRLLIAAALLVLAFGTSALSGAVFWLAVIVAAVFSVTAIVAIARSIA